MKDSFTIVLEDDQILRNICGVNDINLHIMQEKLGSKIFSKGNQLIYQSDDKEKIEHFSILIDQLKNHITLGHTPGQDLIQSIIQNIENGEEKELKKLSKYSIILPWSKTKIFPKSNNQASYIKAMIEYDLVFGIGVAGSGKTFLAVAYALYEILNKKMKKLIITRPVIEAGESLGFLPGDLAQKINPYLRPIYDAMDELVSFDHIKKLEDNRIIEIVPLAYMRGRSFNNSYIILDEAQNTTVEQMKMFLTRLGNGSKAVITGDITQIDLPKNKQSGLIHAERILNGIKEINFSYFNVSDVIRNPLVKKIIRAYETNEK